MTVRAFVIGFSNLGCDSIEVISKISQHAGWDIIYYSSNRESEPVIREEFDNVIYHNSVDAMRGIKPTGLPHIPLQPIDQEILREFSYYESLIILMMDRMDLGGLFNYRERRRLLHTQLRYWLTVIDYFRPDVVLFDTTPHMGFDYLVYILCRMKNVKTIIIERTGLPGLIFTLEEFEKGCTAINMEYLSVQRSHAIDTVDLPEALEQYLARVKSKLYSEGIPFYLKEKLIRSQKGKLSEAGVIRMPVLIFKKLFTLFENIFKLFWGDQKASYYKEKNKKIEDSNFTSSKYYFYMKLISLRKRKRIASHYFSLVEEVDFNKKYIFIALHCQPEKSTSPMGEVFVDQFLFVDLLSKLIPNGWYLYVKEHVSQFKPYKSPERTKSIDFYDDIASLKNTVLIDPSVSSFQLIDNAKATATVTGNAGWESVVRGTPSLIFGHAWYRPCEGVFYTPTIESCQEALGKIAAGYEIDEKKVRLFVKVLEKVCIRGYNHPNWAEASGVSPNQNIDATAQGIIDFYDSIKP